MNAIEKAELNQMNVPIKFENIQTFNDWFKYWFLSFRAQNIRKVTKQKYCMAYNYLYESELGNMNIKNIKRLDVQEYVNSYGATRSKQTVLDNMQYIRSAFRDALTEGLISVNPASNVRMIYKEQNYSPAEQKAMREEKKWLEIDEYQKLKYFLLFQMEDMFNTLDKPTKALHSKLTYYVLVLLAMKTGARFSEMLGLTRDDIDFENNQISIDKTWDYRYKTGFVPTKNYASIRVIPVDKELMDVLKKYIIWLDGSQKQMDSNTLFILKGKPFYLSTANKVLTDLLDEVGISRITFHKLRHTHASYLIAKEIPLQVVAKRLGHTDTNMISQVYGHLLKETENNGNRRILELL